MSYRKIAVVVGVLFIVQIITFGIGRSLIQSFLDGDAERTTLTIGVVLEMVSGLSIVAIGLLMYQVLKLVNRTLALGYPIFRIIEFTVSASFAIYLLSELQEGPNHLLWVYLPTALGGLILTYLLFVSRFVPRAIALLGLVGYALLLLGTLLDFFGALDVNEGAGLVLLAPGGVFELFVFPIWLIAKGFRIPDAATEAPTMR